MSEEPAEPEDSLPLSAELRIDALCRSFEAAWKAVDTGDTRPRIENCLADVGEAERWPLLRELLRVELHYRRGENPGTEEYRRRFPTYAGRLAPLFQEPALPGRGQRTAPEDNRLDAAALSKPDGYADDTPPAPPRDRPAGGQSGTPRGALPSIPGYEILGELGRGGMGVVYQGRHVALNRPVALKMIRAGALAGGPEVSRFRAEAEAVARLQHPNIVQVYDVGEHGGPPYFSLEFCPGGSLAAKLGRTPLPPGSAAPLVEALARAMHTAHGAGVIHRDLKPANVLLAADGTPKITDFGLAKKLDEAGQTASGAVVGTPSYMAPEQARGRSKDVGPWTDVYALGAILYECLTGRPPFKAASALETLAQVLTQEPVPPSRLQPGVPRDLETVCLKCLRKEPHKRYASAEALADDLRRFRAGEPVWARPAPAWERVWKWAMRRPAAAALIAVSTLAVLSLVLGGFALQGERAHRAERELTERRRLDGQRDQVRMITRKGQAAAEGEDWEEAIVEYGQALTLIDLEPLLADLREDVADARRAAVKQRDFQELRVQKLKQFNQLGGDAHFHGLVLAGAAPTRNAQVTRDAAKQALALFGVSADTEAGPVFEEPFTAREKKKITDGCYELLLLQADAEAQPGTPKDVRKAKGTLERAARLARLGLPTKAYHLRLARYLALLHDEAAAAQERQRAQAIEQTDALDEFLLGDEQQRQAGPESLREAIGHFERAVDRQADHFWAHFFLAVCHLRLKEAALAKGSLRACLILQPDLPWPHLLRGMVHAQLGEFEAADADLQDALQRNPNEDASYSIAASRGALRMLQGKYPDAVSELKGAIALSPSRYQAYWELAKVYGLQKRPELALAQLDQALAVARTEPAVLQLLYRTRAGLHAQQDDWGAELIDLRLAIAQEPRDSKSPELAEDHVRCGRLLLRPGRYPDALTAFEAALKVQPTLAAAQLGRCEALLGLERYEDMVRSLDEHAPRPDKLEEPAKLYYLRGVARACRRDYAGAVEEYTRALVGRLDSRTLNSRTLVLRGGAYLFQDALKPALHDFQEALKLDPNNGDAYNGRGYARVQLGQYRQGTADANKAVTCELGKSPALLCNAARVFAQAVGQIDAKPGRPTRQDLAERAGYQDRALKLLREAVKEAVKLERPGERGTFWRKRIAADHDLRPIRESLGYRQLDAEYGRGGQVGGVGKATGTAVQEP
jgi:tetratricopeptide (TPR) repeat protein/tRNA A-37 threonylcarbamoyl transferase component Bud32